MSSDIQTDMATLHFYGSVTFYAKKLSILFLFFGSVPRGDRTLINKPFILDRYTKPNIR